MPEIDGYEVSRRIRARTEHSAALLIALTGWGQEQDHERSRAAGFDHHLVKPVDIGKLHDLLAARTSAPH
jgi:CheY-like chemotaxis protein